MNIMSRIKQIFCKHEQNEIVCWHWNHGVNGDSPLQIEVQLKCIKCGKYYFMDIINYEKCLEFSTKYKDKEWSSKCKPVL